MPPFLRPFLGVKKCVLYSGKYGTLIFQMDTQNILVPLGSYPKVFQAEINLITHAADYLHSKD